MITRCMTHFVFLFSDVTRGAQEAEIILQSMSVLLPLIRQRYKMASAMPVLPDPNENSQRPHRSDGPEPAAIARDRSLQKTKGKYKRRGTSDTKNVS